jgi:gentisate 1,2-dioxygenase
MATTKEAAEMDRAQELELIINELEELNHEANQRNIWIRTKWNLPNQKSWHLGTPDTPPQGPHSLGVEHPSPAPHVWKWADIEKYLLTLIDLCPLELTERQSVLLANPAFGLAGRKVTNTMRIAISIYKKGDDAESHLHSPNASRTIISETGGYTIVEGEKMYPKRGDLVFTPNGTWHAHGNDDDQPVIWADTLDWPLLDYLGGAWARNDPENAADHGDPSDDYSKRFYGRGGIRPLFDPHPRGQGIGNTPMFHYHVADIRGALDDLRDFDADPYRGVIVELVNPENGAPVFTTISYRAQLLRPGEETLAYRHTASTIFFVMDGAGTTDVDGETLAWERNDFFVVPGHRWHRFKNTSDQDAVLYSYTDEPLLSKLGHYHAQGKDASGAVVDLV